MERISEATINSNNFASKQQIGLSNTEAIQIIIDGLNDLLKQREQNFRDHTQRCKKKTIVALQRIFHPFTLLSLAYCSGLIFNIIKIQNRSTQKDDNYPIEYVEQDITITQHIITIVVVLLLIVMDIYLKIQRLNFRVFNIDSKIQKLIEQFQPNNQQVHDDDWRHIFISQSQEKEFSYYQNCFTWTLRGGKWRKIPNNTLARGDIIKLFPGDTTPALVKYFQDESTSEINRKTSSTKNGLAYGLGVSKSPQISSQDPKIFGKGQKIIMHGIDEILSKVQQKSAPTNEKTDPDEAFEKQKKEYKLFQVKRTPCIEDLTAYIGNMEHKKNFSKNLLYFSNVQLAEKLLDIFQALSWIICIAISIGFIASHKSLDYFDKNAFLPLIGYSFIVPQIFSICEAWANALIIALFNSLQFDDYNKKLTGATNFYKLLKQTTNGKDSNNASMVLDMPLLNKKKKKKRKALNLSQILCCLCDRISSNQYQKKQKSKEKIRARKNEKLQQMMTGFVRTDSFYKNYDFQNRGIGKNWKQFWKYVRSGSNHLNNMFAALSSVSILAFVDKEGIISETSKYVDEIGVIDSNEQKVVFDLIHDSHVKNEEDVYSFENPLTYRENLNLLKALGLSMMLTKNPKETDGESQLKEIFTKDAQSAEQIKNEIGFHFHNAMRNEAEAHQDCVCALSKLIGHTDASFHNYEVFGSVWNIKKAQQLQKKEKKNNEVKKVIDLDQIKRQSFDNRSISLLGGSQPEMKSISENESLDIKSFRSEQSVKGKAIFADQKNLKKMLLERSQKFSNIVTTFVKDKSNNKYQSFSRGEANIIFNSCSDYWNGQKIVPLNMKVKNHIKDILFQWQASDFVTVGFSYKPLIPELQQLIEQKTTEKPQKLKELLQSFQKNQIFLGIVGIKHHKKQEANKLFESLDDAGIRGVLFSKEGVLETRSLAKDLGIDSEWNAWISLAENPSDFTKLYNEDGHLILPYGIEGIKKHIEDVDKIPLQVPMFCDSTAETTQQMFQIYQEHGDVVCCIGNIINSENLHIFQQANVAVGMMIEPQYRCYRCNGRISHNQQRSRFSQFSNMNKPEYMPTKLEKLSGAINALACTFVFDANTNIYFFFSVFREARRLRESVEQASLLAIFLYLNVFLILFVDLCLGIYNYIDQLETMYILFVFIPLFSFSCMARPTKNSVMKRHVLSPKYLPYLDFAIWIIKSSFLKVIICTGLMYAVRIYYFREAINQFRSDHIAEYYKAFNVKPGDTDLITNQYNHILYGNYFKLKNNYLYWNLTFEQEHKFNFSFLLIMLIYLSIGFESPNQTLLYKFTKNKIFRLILSLQLLFTFAYYLISTMVFFGPDAPYHVNEFNDYYYPGYQIWLSALACLFIVGLIEELTKRKVRKLFDRDHNRLMIFFSTKLGMWSPR